MIIEESYTFDDVLLQPAYSKIGPADASVGTFISKNIKLNIPLISAAMDTVTEHRLAITMAQLGGIGGLHKNFSIKEQVSEVKKVKKFEAGISTLFNRIKLVAKVSWGLIPPPFFIKLKQYYQKARKHFSDLQ